jgi:hypothetical protein
MPTFHHAIGETMIRIYFSLVMLLFLTGAYAESEKLQTRYGVLRVKESRDKSDIYQIDFNGAKVLNIDALAVDMKRVPPMGEDEYVIIDATVAGLNCHHEFVLLEIKKNGAISASKKFGECHELAGVRHDRKNLVLQLRSSTASTDGVASDIKPSFTEYRWSSGVISKDEEGLSWCEIARRSSEPQWKVLAISDRRRVVFGEGRLYFYSAPDEECTNKKLFIVPGDSMEIFKAFDKYSFISYKNQNTGKISSGWVVSERLK